MDQSRASETRFALFANYLSPAQTEEVRRRQSADAAHPDRWRALVAQWRGLMQSGVDPRAEPAQALVQQWQSLFRESYCGDDAALEARVRDALMNEPGLRIDIGLDEALLDYVQRAHVVAHHLPRENAGPKPSALMVAMQRAAHQLLEKPLVLDDPLALTLLGPGELKSLHAELDRYRGPMAQGMRSFVVVRSRLADDEWAAAAARGVRQRVILGAGLDTSAYRDRPASAPGAEVIFEVDLPATQDWKRARLHESGIAIPDSMRFVPVDFESVSLADGLARAGFDAREPAFFSWLGVTMYLDEAAVFETLRFIAGCAPGSAVLFDYVVPLAGLAPMMRMAMEQVTAQLAASGEPWKSHFESAELDSRLAGLGFHECRHWSPDELNRLYLSGRADGLHLGAGPSRLVLASV